MLVITVFVNLALAVVLAFVAFFHIPITKFPTTSELAKIERVVQSRAQLEPTELAAVRKSMEWIAGNDRMQLQVLFSLRSLAVWGFIASALLAVAQVVAICKLGLLRNPFAFPSSES